MTSKCALRLPDGPVLKVMVYSATAEITFGLTSTFGLDMTDEYITYECEVTTVGSLEVETLNLYVPERVGLIIPASRGKVTTMYAPPEKV